MKEFMNHPTTVKIGTALIILAWTPVFIVSILDSEMMAFILWLVE